MQAMGPTELLQSDKTLPGGGVTLLDFLPFSLFTVFHSLFFFFTAFLVSSVAFTGSLIHSFLFNSNVKPFGFASHAQ